MIVGCSCLLLSTEIVYRRLLTSFVCRAHLDVARSNAMRGGPIHHHSQSELSKTPIDEEICYDRRDRVASRQTQGCKRQRPTFYPQQDCSPTLTAVRVI
jgi:hypothetical protein